ncbi:MAG TPA: low molecular weight protein-tyrosine-phosphatase [Acidimicrobiales bacterium]|nr:low molecular weight protein-tyrosine-phosphatase [Acidimicrobiales bacterium]
MVCLGNICRSPMAAAVAEDLIGQAGLDRQVEVESFGTARYHVGEGADPGAVAALHRHGWTAKPHRARQLEVDDIKAADLVLCADRSNLNTVRRLAVSGGEDPSKVRLLRSFDPGRRQGDDGIPDPWGGGDQDFDLALAAIEPSCEGLVRELATRLAV